MTDQEESTNVQNVIDLEQAGNRLIEEALKFESCHLHKIASLLDKMSKVFSDASTLLKNRSQLFERHATKERLPTEIAPLRAELISLYEVSLEFHSQFTAVTDLANYLPALIIQTLRVEEAIE